MQLIFEKGQISVDSKTFKNFKKQIGKKEGKYKEEDGNKELEISLCKYCFPTINNYVISAPIFQDIYENVDCLVGSIPVQVKCRKDSILTLEEEKIQDGVNKGSWVDRSKAELDLFVFEKSEENLLGYIIYYDKALKKLLNICRKNTLGLELEEDELEFLKDNFIDLKSVIHEVNDYYKLFKIVLP